MKAAFLVVLAACAGSHVQLQAPAPNITPDQRVAMFKALERMDQETEHVSYNHGPWQLNSSTLILANSTRVELPEDLLPVVSPDSDTAKAARASAEALQRARTWKAVAYGVAIAGIAALMVNIDGDAYGVSDDYVFYGVAAATAIPYFVGQYEHHEAMDLRLRAFSTYTRDLGVRLDVCAHNLQVVACETAPSPYPPAGPQVTSPYPPAGPPGTSPYPPAAPQGTSPYPPAPYPPATSPYPPAPAPGQPAPAPSQPAPAPSPPASPLVDPFAPAPSAPAS